MASVKSFIDFIEGHGSSIFGTATSLATLWLTYSKIINDREIQNLKEENENLKKEIFKMTSKVNPESERKLLLEAQKSLQIMGINSIAPLHHCREEIIDFLTRRKGHFQLLLLNPESKEFKDREIKENDSAHRLLSEWHASISILKDIQDHTKGRIELRLRSEEPTRSLFMVDCDNVLTNRSKMLINYYPDAPGMRGYSGDQFLAEFVMERDRDSILNNKQYFQKAWERAMPVSIERAFNLGNWLIDKILDS